MQLLFSIIRWSILKDEWQMLHRKVGKTKDLTKNKVSVLKTHYAVLRKKSDLWKFNVYNINEEKIQIQKY